MVLKCLAVGGLGTRLGVAQINFHPLEVPGVLLEKAIFHMNGEHISVNLNKFRGGDSKPP